MSEPTEWRIVSQAPDYEISRCGRIRRATNNRRGWGIHTEMRSRLDTDGYPVVSLKLESKYLVRKVHRLVCIAYHGEPPTPSHEAAHKDGTRTNSHADNLYWATPSQNAQDRTRDGRTLGRLNPRYKASRVSDDDVRTIRAWPVYVGAVRDIRKHFGISQAYASNIRNGKWKAFVD